MSDRPEDIQRDIDTISRIEAIPTLLRIVSESTGMGFAAVARVTEGTWTACAVHDRINFNLAPGGQLDVHTTLCKEVRSVRQAVVIDHASQDPTYRSHPTPSTYSIESYISVPIVLSDGHYFGNLCAIDPKPANLTGSGALTMFTSFAQLIALQFEAERAHKLEQAALLDERAAGELREQFIAVLGHDLRNPLGAVEAGAALLQRRAHEPELVRDVAQRIARSAGRMSALIDDTLDLARARMGGGIGVEPREVHDLGALLAAVIAELQAVWPQREILSRIDVPDRVWCDPGRIQQLVSNLLANALVHGSPDGTVRVSARQEASAVVLAVSNTGEPIPASHLSQLFGPFWRRSVSPTREGLGLGLYICSQIMAAHGGTLEVTSTREAGTTFTARLPLRN